MVVLSYHCFPTVVLFSSPPVLLTLSIALPPPHAPTHPLTQRVKPALSWEQAVAACAGSSAGGSCGQWECAATHGADGSGEVTLEQMEAMQNVPLLAVCCAVVVLRLAMWAFGLQRRRQQLSAQRRPPPGAAADPASPRRGPAEGDASGAAAQNAGLVGAGGPAEPGGAAAPGALTCVQDAAPTAAEQAPPAATGGSPPLRPAVAAQTAAAAADTGSCAAGESTSAEARVV